MQVKTRVAAGFVALLFGASMAACGGNASSSGDSGNSGAGASDGAAAGGDATGAEGDVVLSMGVVPNDTVTETFNQWGTIIGLLEAATGYTINLYEATDLPAVVEATIAGDLDIIHLGPFGQMIAIDNGAQIETVGATTPGSKGPNNEAVAVVRSDSPITSMEELVGQDICFISPTSTTGYLFGAAEFLDLDISPEDDMNGIFVGDHRSAVRAMWDGECAAVFTYRELAETVFPAENDDVPDDGLRIIWREPLPEAGLSISTQLPQEVQDNLRTALLGITGASVYEAGECAEDRVVEKDGETWCQVWPDGQWGLWETDNSYWEPVREVCIRTEAPACSR